VFFAVAAGVLFAVMFDHFQRRRNVFQLLADGTADLPAKRAAAGTRAFFVGQFVNYLAAGKVIGQRTAIVLPSFLLGGWRLFAPVVFVVAIGRVIRAAVVDRDGIFQSLLQFGRQQFDFCGAEQRQLIRGDAFLLRAVLFAEHAGQLLLQAVEFLRLLRDRLVLRGDDGCVLGDRFIAFNNRFGVSSRITTPPATAISSIASPRTPTTSTATNPAEPAAAQLVASAED